MEMVLGTLDTIQLNKLFIKRIRRTDKNISLFFGAKYHYTKGFFASLQFGGGESVSQAALILGYRFNKKLAAGIGFGNSYNYSSNFNIGFGTETNSTPVFAYGRYYHFDTKVKPFIAAKVGWGFPNQNAFGGDHEGGFLVQPEIGVNFASRRHFRFLLSIGQQFQNTRGDFLFFDNIGNPVDGNFNVWFSRTVFKIGLEFH